MLNVKPNDPIEDIEKTIKKVHDESGKKTKTTFRKYPILFSLLVTLGFVSVLHGFELLFSKIIFIQNNPYVLIISGLIILIFTGSLYKIIDKK
jgi:hypothetical protein